MNLSNLITEIDYGTEGILVPSGRFSKDIVGEKFKE